MNKNTRLLVSVLFAVLIVLAIAITKFYVVFPETSNVDKQSDITAIIESDDSGYIIFRNDSGDLGIAQSGWISAAPEWKELSFAGNGRCIAAKKLNGKLLYGCIDYDGNVTVPLVYDKIKRFKSNGMTFFAAQTAQDGSYVLYDEEFYPCFRYSWKTCDIGENDITLTDGGGTYVYSVTVGGLLFKSAEISSEMLDCEYSLKVYSRVLLSKLSVPMIGQMLSDTARYFDYAFDPDDDLLSELTDGGRNTFAPLFGSDETVKSRKLLGISNIYIYSVGTKEDSQEFEVSVNADTEVVCDAGEGKEETLRDRCKASVRFRGTSESDLTLVSGKFDKEKPERPVQEVQENV